MRGSTAGLFYTAPPGLKIPLPSSLLRSYAVAGDDARKLFFKFRFIEQRKKGIKKIRGWLARGGEKMPFVRAAPYM